MFSCLCVWSLAAAGNSLWCLRLYKEEIVTDLHMESTRWRDVMHVGVHNRCFQCCSQHWELVCTDVGAEELQTHLQLMFKDTS